MIGSVSDVPENHREGRPLSLMGRCLGSRVVRVGEVFCVGG